MAGTVRTGALNRVIPPSLRITFSFVARVADLPVPAHACGATPTTPMTDGITAIRVSLCIREVNM